MPIYEFKCKNSKCKTKLFEEIRNHEQAGEPAFCPHCGEKANRVFSLSGFKFDFRPGFDPGLGQYVDTKRQRENITASQNLRRIKD